MPFKFSRTRARRQYDKKAQMKSDRTVRRRMRRRNRAAKKA